MTPSTVSRRAVVDRLELVDELLDGVRSLPLESREAFLGDRRNLWAAESCLRRCLEALLDVGRHILARGYGVGVSEYKEIAAKLREAGVLSSTEGETLRLLAGYRNRLVHFYHEVTPGELYEICTGQLGDVEKIRSALGAWLAAHPDLTRP